MKKKIKIELKFIMFILFVKEIKVNEILVFFISLNKMP